MIFYTYQTLQEFNQTGFSGILSYVANTVPIFTPMLLFSFFMVALFGSYFSQKRLLGRENFAASFAVAGYLTAIASYILMLLPNTINSLTVVVCTVVAIIGTIVLLTSD